LRPGPARFSVHPSCGAGVDGRIPETPHPEEANVKARRAAFSEISAVPSQLHTLLWTQMFCAAIERFIACRPPPLFFSSMSLSSRLFFVYPPTSLRVLMSPPFMVLLSALASYPLRKQVVGQLSQHAARNLSSLIFRLSPVQFFHPVSFCLFFDLVFLASPAPRIGLREKNVQRDHRYLPAPANVAAPSVPQAFLLYLFFDIPLFVSRPWIVIVFLLRACGRYTELLSI